MNWIVTLVGSREHYAVPRAFLRRGELLRLYADAWCGFGRGLLGRGPATLRALAGRYHDEIPAEKVTAFTGRSLLERFNRPKLADHAAAIMDYLRIGRQFCEMVNRDLHKRHFDRSGFAFYGYDTACLETMQMLKERGTFCVVNQIDPGRVEDEMVLEEVERFAGWEKVEGKKPQIYWQRLQDEWKLADAVVVNSQWSKDALVKQGVEEQKILVIPLAYEESPRPAVKRESGGPLQVLWLGTVILRKGIQYLLEAARLLPPSEVRITVAGPVWIAQEAVQSAPPNMKFIGRVTRDQAAGIYQQADVFVLPTISDGFAITQLEAMGHGLPVIATPNCGKVVTDGVDGKIVPIRDPRALAEAIMAFASDRRMLRSASEAAKEKSKQFSVDHLAQWLGEVDALAEARQRGRVAV